MRSLSSTSGGTVPFNGCGIRMYTSSIFLLESWHRTSIRPVWKRYPIYIEFDIQHAPLQTTICVREIDVETSGLAGSTVIRVQHAAVLEANCRGRPLGSFAPLNHIICNSFFSVGSRANRIQLQHDPCSVESPTVDVRIHVSTIFPSALLRSRQVFTNIADSRPDASLSECLIIFPGLLPLVVDSS